MQRALFSNEAGQGSAPIAHSAARTDEPVREGVVAGLEPFVDTICVCTITAVAILLSGVWNRPPEIPLAGPVRVVAAGPTERWTAEPTPVAAPAADLGRGVEVFVVVATDHRGRAGNDRLKLHGALEDDTAGAFRIAWGEVASASAPRVVSEGAFDSVLPGLGRWVVPATVWLFAISTVISWSYYGEQAIVFLLGAWAVRAYRVAYCLLVLVAASPLIATQEELDLLSSFGTGVMLWANIPILLLFGRQAMRAYHRYMRSLNAGDFEASQPDHPRRA
jgi:AGCS family alanine or glycine:cation symporter